VKKSFNTQELLHCKSKHHETKPMHPSFSRAFQRDQEHDLNHPSLMDLRSTNQTKQNNTNKLPSYPSFFRFIQILHIERDMQVAAPTAYNIRLRVMHS
jgi:hypothetical protein